MQMEPLFDEQVTQLAEQEMHDTLEFPSGFTEFPKQGWQ
jgi:hypothetical protein